MPPLGIALVSFLVAAVIVAPIGVYEYRSADAAKEVSRARSNIPNGLPIPVRIPMNAFTTPSTYNVPYWLGGFAVTTPSPSIWTLPLTYNNGGKVQPGEFLQIRNYGPASITLQTTAPETIESGFSYIISPEVTLQVLSDTNWVATSIISSGNSTNTSLYASEVDTCALVVGKDWDFSTLATATYCGFAAIGRLIVGGTAAGVASRFGALVVSRFVNVTANGQYGANINLLATLSALSPVNAFVQGASIGSILSAADASTSTTFVGLINGASFYGNIGGEFRSFNAPLTFGANWTGSGVVYRMLRNAPTFSTGATGTIALYEALSFVGCPASSTMNCTDATVIRSANLNGKGTNAVVRSAEQTGGTLNAIVFFDTNSATCGAGIVAGTVGDTCLYRAAAGVWTFNSGASLRVPGYTCTGCTSAPANTAVGSFSTTSSNPTLQAFGAVTANAASGTLAFTVSTAALTCGTATITNTNVATSSEVILTIQSYTGTQYTNGIPRVFRQNTAGSSSGSFVLQLCNDHATNALSGSLYVAFWVLN